MTRDDGMTWGLIIDVLEVLERHGYHEHDGQHTDQAIGMIGDLAHLYEGYPGASHAPYRHPAPSSWRHEPGPPGVEADHDVVILTGADISTVFAALDTAADYQRERAGMCADCGDQSCPACQHCLQDAQACDRLVGRMFDPARTVGDRPPEPGGRPDPAADKEAGQ